MGENPLDIILRLRPEMAAGLAQAQQQFNAAMTSMAANTKQVEAANTRLVNSLSGARLINDAKNIAKAIDEIGGTAALTEREIQKFGATAAQAVEKARAIGVDLPPGVKKLADEFKALQATNAPSWLEGLGKEIGTVAAGFVSAQAVIGAARTAFSLVVGEVRDSIKAYADAEVAQTKLTAALRQHGLATPQVISQYNEMATEFQRTTVFSDDLINSMQGLLTQVGGVMPSKMKEALKASTDLASGLGIDLESSTRLVAKAAAGHTETLGRYGITVSDAALKTRGFDAVLEAVNRQFGGQAQAQVETYAGKIEQLKNSWNNVQEAVGKFIVSDPLVEKAMRDLINRVKELEDVTSGKPHEFDTSNTLFGWLTEATAEYSALIPVVGQLTQDWKVQTEQAELVADAINTVEASLRRALALPIPEEWKRLTGGQITPVAPPFTGDVGTFTGAVVNQLGLSDAQRMSLVLQDLNEKTTQLTGTVRQAALASFAHGKSVEETMKALELYWPAIDKSKGALELLHKEYEQGIEKQKKYQEAAKAIAAVENGQFEVLNRVDAATVKRIQSLAKEGVEQGKLATFFHLTDVEIKALIVSGELYDKLLKLNNESGIAGEDVLKKLGHAAHDTDSEMIRLSATYQKLFEIESGFAKFPSQNEFPGFKIDPKDQLPEIERRAKQVDDAFKAMADTFRSLGQTAGGTFGLILSALGSQIDLLHRAADAAAVVRAKGATATQAEIDFANLTRKQATYAAISSGFSIAASAIDTSGSASRGAIVASGALQGAAAGASVGSYFGPWGIAAGAAGGAIVGWIQSGKEWRQVIQDIGRDFAGIHVSDDFAKMIADLEDQAGVGSAQALTLALDQLIQSVGGLTSSNLDMFTGKLRDTFVMLGRNELTAAQATQILDKNFQNFVQAATDSTGRLNDQVRELIDLNDQYGTHSKAIADYQKSQAGIAAGGLGPIVGALDDTRFDAIKQHLDSARKAVDDLNAAGKKGSDEWKKASEDLAQALKDQAEFADLNREKLADLGTIAVSTFAAAYATTGSYTGALAAVHEGLDRLRLDYEALGLSIDDVGLRTILADDKFFAANKKQVSGLQALATTMNALSNMGKGVLTPEAFQAMERSGVAMINDLFNQAKIAGASDQDAVRQALLGGQEFLHAAQKEAKSRGETLDPQIAEKIKQSMDLGIWVEEGKKDTDRILDKLDAILRAIQGLPPLDYSQGGAGEGGTAPPPPDRQQPGGGIVIDFPRPGGGLPPDVWTANAAASGARVTSDGLLYAAKGAKVLQFKPKGTDVVPAMLTPGERVLSVAQTKAFDAARPDTDGRDGSKETKALYVQSTKSDMEKYKVMADIARRQNAWTWLGSTDLGGTEAKGAIGSKGTKASAPAPWEWLGNTELGGTESKGPVGSKESKSSVGDLVHHGDVIIQATITVPKGDVDDHQKVLKIVNKDIADKGETFQTIQVVAARKFRQMAR